jgi:glycosyltransferase involved in cell wall biosynthesis
MKKLQKIVLYYSAIVNPGGAERLLLEEYNFLRRIGIKTRILTFRIKKEALFNYKVPDLEVLRCKSGFLLRVISLRRRLNEINPDLVISTCPSELYLATLFTPLSYVLHIHGSLFWFDDELLKYAIIHKGVFNEIRGSVIGHREFIPLKPKCNIINRIKLEFVAILDYLAVRKAKEIIVLTPQVRWEVEKLYKRRPVIARGCLDPGIFDHTPKKNIKNKWVIDNAKIILSVSRLDRRKRLDVLIKAFAKLSKKMNDKVILVIVGTGSDEKRLKLLAKQSNCSDKIIFTGFVSDDELWDYYHACDVFACPGWTTSPITR